MSHKELANSLVGKIKNVGFFTIMLGLLACGDFVLGKTWLQQPGGGSPVTVWVNCNAACDTGDCTVKRPPFCNQANADCLGNSGNGNLPACDKCKCTSAVVPEFCICGEPVKGPGL